MTTPIHILQSLQTTIAARNEPDWPDDYTEKLYFAEIHGLIHVEYYGDSFDEPYEEFLNTVCHSDVAPYLRSLVLRGPDEGANGTRNWDLARFADIAFPNLNTFFIEPAPPEYHNFSIIAAIYDEEGQIARAVANMPVLQSLTVPSAPDSGFFSAAGAELNYLRVESGYDHQDFILNLSQSNNLPRLRMLDFGDYNQRRMKDYAEQCTPFSHYEQMFRSPAFASVTSFRLRNSMLSTDQLSKLSRIREDLQFFQIQSYGHYLR